MKKVTSLLIEIRLVAVFFVLLVSLILVINPSFFVFESLGTTLGLMAPLILAACASVPVILCGREGIDLSVGPLIGFINVIVIQIFVFGMGIQHPIPLIFGALLIGVVVGAINGLLTVFIRIKPIVATLGMYLILSGLSVWLLPAPIGPAPDWLIMLSEDLSFLPLLAVFLFWFLFRKLPLYGYMKAIGNDDRAAFAAGVNVNLVRFLAYILASAFAAVAALSLTGLLGSADSQIGPNYTLIAIAAAVLGGVSLAGGKGGLLGASLGALDIFLLQNLITYFNASTFILQITYGMALVLALVIGSDKLSKISSGFKLTFSKEKENVRQI